MLFMVDIKKLKKLMIDKEVSNTEIKMLLNITNQGLHNKLHYINKFTTTQIQKLIEYFNCSYEDLTHESLQEYEEEVIERLENY